MKKSIIESNWLFYSIIFIIIFIFYAQAHPIVLFDTDDWGIVVLERPAFPKMSLWNPTKIFPECIAPIIASFAAFFVVPIVGDYFDSLIYCNALLISLFITAYLYSVQKVIEYRFNIGKLSVFGIISIFTILHFLLLKTLPSDNDHLWYSHDYTCYYHYTMPELLCMCIVLWLMRHEVKELKNMKQWAIFLTANYLALCSNLYATVILIAYIGSSLVVNLFTCSKNKKKWLIDYILHNCYYLIVIIFWLIIQWIESHGHRATSYGHLYDPIWEYTMMATKNFFEIQYNKYAIIFSALIFVCAKIVAYYKYKQKLLYFGKKQIIVIFAMILTIIYQILLCSRVEVPYIKRADVIFSFAFFFLLLVVFGMSYICSNNKYIRYLFPFIIFFFLFEINTKENTFKDIMNEHGYTAQTCLDFNRKIVNQIQLAEAIGKDTVYIKIPKYEEADNWPLISDSGNRVGMTLYKHNVISRKIVTIYEVQNN